MDLTVISEHISNGKYDVLYNIIGDTNVSHISSEELRLIYQDIINRVILSNNFSFREICNLTNRIRNRQDNHMGNHLQTTLISSMVSHDIANYQATIKTLRKHSFYHVFYDICKLVVKNWFEHHIEDFVYIRSLYQTPMSVSYLRESMMLLLRYGNMETMLNFVAHSGFDIHTLHLDGDLPLMKYDWYGFQEEYEDMGDDVINKICDYTKYHTKIKFFTQLILILWSSDFAQISDLEFIKELYTELDEEMRSIILSYALHEMNTSAIQLISQFENIQLTQENLDAVLEQLGYLINLTPETKTKWSSFMDALLEFTDFIDKISMLPADSEPNYMPIVKIIKKLKS
jgi:hypothetical protein